MHACMLWVHHDGHSLKPTPQQVTLHCCQCQQACHLCAHRSVWAIASTVNANVRCAMVDQANPAAWRIMHYNVAIAPHLMGVHD